MLRCGATLALSPSRSGAWWLMCTLMALETCCKSRHCRLQMPLSHTHSRPSPVSVCVCVQLRVLVGQHGVLDHNSVPAELYGPQG